MDQAGASYEEDFVVWSREQAAALRDAGRAGANLPLDWENIAEEIESLGRSERRELGSQIARIIRHLAKLEHSPAVDPRPGWRISIREARAEIERVLQNSPSLGRELASIAGAELARALRLAADDLEEHGELTRERRMALLGLSYTVDQVLGDWFPPDPDHG